MHFRKQIRMCGKKILIEGVLHRRSHSIPMKYHTNNQPEAGRVRGVSDKMHKKKTSKI